VVTTAHPVIPVAEILDPAALAVGGGERADPGPAPSGAPTHHLQLHRGVPVRRRLDTGDDDLPGVIVDDAAGTVLARPYPKFFHHDQPGAPKLRFDAPAVVTDKVDGSLPADWTPYAGEEET
jgi:RNA ligase